MTSAIVIPTYQEAENVELLLRSIREACPELKIFVVDDNSPDGTGKIAEAVGLQVGGIVVLHRQSKSGLGAAYRHGFGHVMDQQFDFIGQMDADLSHDPKALPALFHAVANGADVAVGSRYVPGGSVPQWTWFRRKLSTWGNAYARVMLRLTLTDATTAFRVYRSEVLNDINIQGTTANGYLFLIESAFRLSASGCKIVELPITFADRIAGDSKMPVLRTIIETELRVTGWGLALRAPGFAGLLCRTPSGRFIHSRLRPAKATKPAN